MSRFCPQRSVREESERYKIEKKIYKKKVKEIKEIKMQVTTHSPRSERRSGAAKTGSSQFSQSRSREVWT